jgi:hypothetical protein
MYRQHVTTALVQPGQHDDLVTDAEIRRGLDELGPEDDSRERRTLIALLRGGVAVGQR